MNLEPIDTSTTAGKARVMQLAAEGREIAERATPVGKWSATSFPMWDWRNYDYAIFAEPVGPEEIFAIVDGRGKVGWTAVDIGAAEKSLHLGWHIVKYRRADLAGRDE
jgi:hypothetical protein